MHTLKPLDVECIIKAARTARGLVTVEEHSVHGGLGEACAAVLAQNRISLPFRIVGIPDEATVNGSQLGNFRTLWNFHEGISRNRAPNPQFLKVTVPFILALDQSTSATKALLFDSSGQLVDKTSVEHQQHYPQPGWVEHDAEEIYQNAIEACRLLLQKNRPVAHEILCLSITNQRETVVVFEKASGRPLHHAIVWQCRRGSALCEELVRAGYEELARAKTGLRIDTYFPASKLTWLFDALSPNPREARGGRGAPGDDRYVLDLSIDRKDRSSRVITPMPAGPCSTTLASFGGMKNSAIV